MPVRNTFYRYEQTNEEDFVNGFNYHVSFDLNSLDRLDMKFPDYVTTPASADFYMEIYTLCELLKLLYLRRDWEMSYVIETSPRIMRIIENQEFKTAALSMVYPVSADFIENLDLPLTREMWFNEGRNFGCLVCHLVIVYSQTSHHTTISDSIH